MTFWGFLDRIRGKRDLKVSDLPEALLEAWPALEPEERAPVQDAVAELTHSCGRSIGKDAALFKRRIYLIWSPPPAATRSAKASEASVLEPDVLYSFDLPDPDRDDARKDRQWSLTLSDAFVKDTTCIDRKLQGRILECLMQLAGSPMEARGDTQKPLTGNLHGLWRLRLGDHRLIYRPDPRESRIYCLAFAPRGGAYA